MTEFIFWFSLAGLVYVYLGYPILVKVLAALFPMRRERQLAEILNQTCDLSTELPVVDEAVDREIAEATA